jgi:hypothetical protein
VAASENRQEPTSLSGLAKLLEEQIQKESFGKANTVRTLFQILGLEAEIGKVEVVQETAQPEAQFAVIVRESQFEKLEALLRSAIS